MTPAPSSDPSLGLLGSVPVNPLTEAMLSHRCVPVYLRVSISAKSWAPWRLRRISFITLCVLWIKYELWNIWQIYLETLVLANTVHLFSWLWVNLQNSLPNCVVCLVIRPVAITQRRTKMGRNFHCVLLNTLWIWIMRMFYFLNKT